MGLNGLFKAISGPSGASETSLQPHFHPVWAPQEPPRPPQGVYLGRLLQSGFNRSASNRHNRALKTIGNRIFHAIWSIGQCGQSAILSNLPIKTFVQCGQSGKVINLLAIQICMKKCQTSMRADVWLENPTNYAWLELPIGIPDWKKNTHWTHWIYQSGQSAIGF